MHFRLFAVVFLALVASCKRPTLPPEPPITETVGTTIPAYNRDEWGRWMDADRDCQDTRQEVLIAESEIPVTFVDPLKPCRVASGRWTDPYTGAVVTDPAALEIDHTVALEEAHKAGAWQWSTEQKKAYYNDLENPNHLQAATISANRSKGSRGPTEWMPTNEAFRCEYLRRRVQVFTKYKLAYDCQLYFELAAKYCK